ncbi:glutathione S-transferase theta-1 isoform X1 [Ailuropoda melanoleuca]|uniref:glutathione S-transferase theta-1 isoform X1 n=1 Tax=Ailuropoda melanoleuca TaxID=9646 RepID=UPI001494E360|nr:glutathione S-transferase theta-1 isoform X1 [Ailuropoda melanoleuca]
MPLELFLDLYSPPCRAIYIFAMKNGIPFELRSVELGRGEHLKPEFLKVNPLGKVPALKDGDFLLAESVAILLYLSRKYHAAAHWYPPELQACARVDEYLAWQHTAVQLPATNIYLCKSLLPYFSEQSVDPVCLDRLLGKLKPALQHLDREVLAAKPFLATEELSLADLMAFTELMQLPCLPSPLLLAAMSSKTGPGWQHGKPEWRLLWALSSSGMPTGLCYSLGTPGTPSGTPSWPRSWCRDCWSGSAEGGVAGPAPLHSPVPINMPCALRLPLASLGLGRWGLPTSEQNLEGQEMSRDDAA